MLYIQQLNPQILFEEFKQSTGSHSVKSGSITTNRHRNIKSGHPSTKHHQKNISFNNGSAVKNQIKISVSNFYKPEQPASCFISRQRTLQGRKLQANLKLKMINQSRVESKLLETNYKSTRMLNQDLQCQDDETARIPNNKVIPVFSEINIGKPVYDIPMSMTQAAGFRNFNRVRTRKLVCKPPIVDSAADYADRCRSCLNGKLTKHHSSQKSDLICACASKRKIATIM